MLSVVKCIILKILNHLVPANSRLVLHVRIMEYVYIMRSVYKSLLLRD